MKKGCIKGISWLREGTLWEKLLAHARRVRSIDKHGGFERDELDALRKSIVVWLPNGFGCWNVFKKMWQQVVVFLITDSFKLCDTTQKGDQSFCLCERKDIW